MRGSGSDALGSLQDLIRAMDSSEQVAAMRELGLAIGRVLAEEKLHLAKDVAEKDIQPRLQKAKGTLRTMFNVISNAIDEQRSLVEKIRAGETEAAVEELKAKATSGYEAAKVGAARAASGVVDTVRGINANGVKFVDRMRAEYQSLDSEDERARYILRTVLYASVLSYGFYVGHELPDADFKLWGAGAHRSFLSHSVVPFLAVSAGLTVLLRALERAEGHLKTDEAKQLCHTIKTVLSLFGLGVGSGMTFHLVVDGLVQTGGTILIHDLSGNSYGSIFSGTRIDDMAYTTAMSLFTANEAKKYA